MQIHSIPLRDDSDAVHLDAYLLYNSSEFQTDQRRPVVIVCPGGGYLFTSDREAEPVALRFAAQGYHTFVLRYSVRTRFPQPMLDIAKAIAIVRANAELWHIHPDQIAVCGFSAGGHLCASIGVFWDKPFLHEKLGLFADQIKPNALILGYPVIDLTMVSPITVQVGGQGDPVLLKEMVLANTLGDPNPAQEELDRYRADLHVSAATPPTFIWHTDDDEMVPARNALIFALALAEQQIPYELHIFQQGLHGLSLADETTATQERPVTPHCQVWMELAIKWLKRQFSRTVGQ